MQTPSDAAHAEARMQAWMESARHAYAYLFFTRRDPSERAFEDRQTQARDWYNHAVQQASILLFDVLDEQGRTHHIGTFPDLEQQMCEFDPVDPDDAWSPDRMDAMVWAMTELMVGSGLVTTREMVDTRLRGRR